MAREIKAAVFFTVEHSLSGEKRSIAFMFSGDDYGRRAARDLFVHLAKPLGATMVLAEGQYETVSTSWVNLIVWDRHPTQDGAQGIIIDAFTRGDD